MARLDYSILGAALIFVGLSGLVDSSALRELCEKIVCTCGGVLIGRSL